ncbi:MAG TPA: EAL domain-containing protein [Leptospiraceae bacterium]|nr:EAL domain-containing protein [Leptospiraceae bacterium]HMY65863.1 EAL domain-containing protein [Leptospiraceae bacterium]HNF14488.1 EAL domain-containing protein [Leptospiraceae bacterium]HNF24362.1 EAL domain-containing protein [Leptospiraceae bacterium]HNH07673.1 EAL domain-containing protein [Leptospiraceae bacterium]
MNSDWYANLLEAQQQVIEKIALGHSLSECLELICLLIESTLNEPEARSSILLLEGYRLWTGAAPNLPKSYCKAIDGLMIGPKVGSCGTAAFTKKQVIVENIETDPLWEEFKEIALFHQLYSCWSNPILSSANEVLGSFAIYYTRPKYPEKHHLDLIARFTHLSGLAIEKARLSKREADLTLELMNNNRKFSAFTSVMPDLAMIIDEDGKYVDVYGGDQTMLYDSVHNLLGNYIKDILPPQKASDIMNVIQRAIQTGKVQIFEYRLPVPKGILVFEGRVAAIEHYLPNEPEKRHVLWMARDITENKRAQAEIENLAFYDSLTHLPNRRLLIERLQLLIHRSQHSRIVSSLLYLDLDDFKRINDTLGHSVGDLLLVSIADRLKPLLEGIGIFARIGGDEFVILLEGMELDLDIISEASVSIASKIIEAFSLSFKIQKGEFRIGTSIGISIIHGENMNADEVLKRADAAMYISKQKGGNCFTFFDPSLQKILDSRLEVEQGIIRAVKEGEFCAYFQPQVSTDNKVFGAEALIRWIHPEKGIISPLEFIPIAEQFGLIHQLQNIVLHDACRLLNMLTERGLIDDDFTVSVNISAIQFRNPELKKALNRTMENHRLSPRRIKLEITESTLIDNIDHTLLQMKLLKNEGYAFSIDDFGTGYSSLTYLQTFPIDELKIDKSFVDKIQASEVGTAIVDAIIALSQHMGFEVIAEGVEHKSQVDILSKRGIKAMQGYFFGRPMTADKLAEWLQSMRDEIPA